MKKILTHLTGIVFLITILAAGGCNSNNQQNDQTAEGTTPEQEIDKPAEVYIYLKAVTINKNIHLEMSDTKKPDCVAIDGLITVVIPGDTVIWREAPNSNIDKIIEIRPMKNDENLFRNGVETIEVDSIWTLRIPDIVKPDTVKYEIKFTVKHKKDTITIDPYLKLPEDKIN